MEKLKLNNGTEFDGNALQSEDLFLYMYNTNIQTVFNSLINPENTATITYTMVNGEEIVYEGFTTLISVRVENETLTTAVMRKGVLASV